MKRFLVKSRFVKTFMAVPVLCLAIACEDVTGYEDSPVDGYVAVVDGLTITNTHNIITKDIPVSKVWVDNSMLLLSKLYARVKIFNDGTIFLHFMIIHKSCFF